MLKSSTFWKAFLVVWLLYAGYVLVLTTNQVMTPMNGVFLALLLIGAVAIFGLGFQKSIAWQPIWGVFFFVALVVHALLPVAAFGMLVAEIGVSNAVEVTLRGQPPYYLAIFPILVLLQVIYLYGLYRYGFKSDRIWNKG